MGRHKALVIHDDPKIVAELADISASLCHTYQWVRSQQEARDLIRANSYLYILLALEIPARSKGSKPSQVNGLNLFDEILSLGTAPIIVLLGFHSKVALAREKELEFALWLMRKGAADVIRQPLRGGPRTLDKAIKKVLAGKSIPHGAEPRPLPSAAAKPRAFVGGKMVFYPDHVELCNVTILGDTGSGQCRTVLDVLKCRKPDGRYVHVGGEKLATELGAKEGIGTVTGCVRRIRLNATKRLREQLGLVVGNEDVVANDRRYGYCLKEWITVINAADAVAGSQAHRDEPVAEPVSEPVDDTVTTRREQILAALAGNERLCAPAIAAKVKASVATVKRDLAALKREGKVTFDGPPKSGRYRLVG